MCKGPEVEVCQACRVTARTVGLGLLAKGLWGRGSRKGAKSSLLGHCEDLGSKSQVRRSRGGAWSNPSCCLEKGEGVGETGQESPLGGHGCDTGKRGERCRPGCGRGAGQGVRCCLYFPGGAAGFADRWAVGCEKELPRVTVRLLT